MDQRYSHAYWSRARHRMSPCSTASCVSESDILTSACGVVRCINVCALHLVIPPRCGIYPAASRRQGQGYTDTRAFLRYGQDVSGSHVPSHVVRRGRSVLVQASSPPVSGCQSVTAVANAKCDAYIKQDVRRAM